MPLVEVTLPPLHAAQREVVESDARYKVVAAGRRFGKSRLGSALALEKAVAGGIVWWVAKDYPITVLGWRMVKSLCRPLIHAGVPI
jgi:hypothetical protein